MLHYVDSGLLQQLHRLPGVILIMQGVRTGATDSGLGGGGSLFRKGALGGRGPFLSEPTFYYVKYLLSCFNPCQSDK